MCPSTMSTDGSCYTVPHTLRAERKVVLKAVSFSGSTSLTHTMSIGPSGLEGYNVNDHKWS